MKTPFDKTVRCGSVRQQLFSAVPGGSALKSEAGPRRGADDAGWCGGKCGRLGKIGTLALALLSFALFRDFAKEAPEGLAHQSLQIRFARSRGGGGKR